MAPAPARPPRIAIVGFPNVGKSTLFNRLAGRRISLVHSQPGMTRDRLAAAAVLRGRRVELADTGGFIDVLDKAEPLAAKVHETAWAAARSADVILLLLDGKRGLLPAEQDLYQELKRLGRPLVVAVNKADSASRTAEMSDFYRLREPGLLFISAENLIGLDELEEALAALLPVPSRVPAPSGGPPPSAEPEAADEPALRIAVIGRINVGKSSLVNRLCGEERFIVSELPGTTRDSGDVLIRSGSKSFVLVDTAGIRKLGRTADDRESAGVIRSGKSVERADAVCLVLDALEFPTRQDAAVAALARESGKPLVVAVNKWDKVREGAIPQKDIEAMVFKRLDFISYAAVLTVSALTGRGVVRILEAAETAWRNGRRKAGTAALNRFLESIHLAHPPLAKTGRRFKIKYMTQAGVLPPTFRLFAGSRAGFAPAYEKFFEERLRRSFGFAGNPIRLIFS